MIPFTQLMKEKVFTWQNPDTKEELTFASERMTNWCRSSGVEIVWTPVDIIWAKAFVDFRGIEPHRLGRLDAAELLRWEPIIYCHMPDNTHLLVDGHHRYVVAAMEGLTEIKARILEPNEWEPFLVSGLPTFGYEHLTTSYSGIE